MYRTIRLRTKFLLSILAVTAGLTAATLYVVSYGVEMRVRESFRGELHSSVKTYETFARKRESSLVRPAQMLANLPNVRALMTTEDAATIQDESARIWRMSGGDLPVLANRSGEITGLQTSGTNFGRGQAQESLRASIQNGESRNWWFGGEHLYEVRVQPIYLGAAQQQNVRRILAVGHEINENRARDFSRVVAREVIFRCGKSVVATTLPGMEDSRSTVPASLQVTIESDLPGEFDYRNARYLATTVNLSTAGQIPVTLSVLKSLDQETIFLSRLNQILLGGPETKLHIFEPFFTTREIGKGTGLGLVTVYGIIKQSGWFIWVESALGKGTTFEIYLPHSTKAVLLSGEMQKEKLLAGRNETVFVVEDEPGVLKLASEFLKAGGYNILEASEGAEALRIVNSHSGTVDIVLTDMVMPGMSGSELAETLKKIRPGTRVIHMGGYAEFSGTNGERPPGETRVLQKPFSRNTLLEKVRKQRAQRPSVLKMPRRWADRPDCRRAALFGT